jgi:hypothetical protein
MRRIALAVIAASVLASAAASPAFADPTPGASVPVPAATPGQSVCSVDSALTGLTGLVATADGYAVVNGGNTGDSLKVYVLDSSCKRSRSLNYPPGTPLDPQDVQIDARGNYWVADTGTSGNGSGRARIAVWKVAPEGRTGTLYRFTYPDGAVPEVQAMVLGGDGLPVFVTKNAGGAASVYLPAGTLDAATGGKATTLKKAGQFTPQKTGTANKLGPAGQTPVTGGATSPDGKKVALRTFSDAYEWDVTGGNVAAAITTGTPRITPLPNEDQGVGIAYSHDGKYFLTLAAPQGTKAQILKYTPSVPQAAKAPVAGNTGTKGGDTRSWFSKLSLQDITYLVGGLGLIGLLMVAGGIIGIRRARKRGPNAKPAAQARNSPWDGDDLEAANEPISASARVDGERRGRYGDRYEDDRYPAGDYPSSRGGYEPDEYPQPAHQSPGYNKGGQTYGRPARPEGGYQPAPPIYQPPPRGYESPQDPRGYKPPADPRGYQSPAPPSGRAPRGDAGVARPHRPEPRREPRGTARPTGGYPEDDY